MTRNYLRIHLIALLFVSIQLTAQTTFVPKPVELPNSWSLSPAGSALNLSSDLPLNLAVSPSQRYAAVTDNGHGKEGIDLVDISSKKLLSFTKLTSAWLGLQFSRDCKYLYDSAGNKNMILKFKVKNDTPF